MNTALVWVLFTLPYAGSYAQIPPASLGMFATVGECERVRRIVFAQHTDRQRNSTALDGQCVQVTAVLK